MLNDAGEMVEKWWYKLKNKFQNIELHESVIMPNHFHGIIQITTVVIGVGADLRVCPDKTGSPHMGQSRRIAPTDRIPPTNRIAPTGAPLYEMVQWFKTMTTNEYIRNVKQNNWIPFNRKLWQRNYYEHIIRNEKSYYQIAEYILNNPVNWREDEYF